MIAAMQIAEKKVWEHRSYRVDIRQPYEAARLSGGGKRRVLQTKSIQSDPLLRRPAPCFYSGVDSSRNKKLICEIKRGSFDIIFAVIFQIIMADQFCKFGHFLLAAIILSQH